MTGPTFPLCAWVSRHDPTPAMRAALAAYTIVPVRNRQPVVRDLWLDVVTASGRALPTLIVLVAARAIYTPFVLLAARCAPETTVIRPVMFRDPEQPDDADAWIWTGAWDQLVPVPARQPTGTERHLWTPEVELNARR